MKFSAASLSSEWGGTPYTSLTAKYLSSSSIMITTATVALVDHLGKAPLRDVVKTGLALRVSKSARTFCRLGP